MYYSPEQLCAAFVGPQLIATGPLVEVVNEVKRHHDAHPNDMILIFDHAQSRPIEVDLRGSMEDVFERLEKQQKPPESKTKVKKPGRPKLGVVSKEVTLLPKHWEWLAQQRGGASVTLRRLVGEAMKAADPLAAQRTAQQSTYRLMTAVAGDLPNYEDAIRALFAAEEEEFINVIADWPEGLRAHIIQISAVAFDPSLVPETEESDSR
ncbi:DUF2239 family protein [Maritalea mediterranea]|uniref:DUF2239 family protein n=1 Tax=Maritalea mediterranea TaxID=2909667 RepID=A0ABS9E748_9HYPH|nr:DUF2239 family protein [Maritalea mediterranea]MCF4098705.1 DUF2239 family protein [Maritalea mediterranea]